MLIPADKVAAHRRATMFSPAQAGGCPRSQCAESVPDGRAGNLKLEAKSQLEDDPTHVQPVYDVVCSETLQARGLVREGGRRRRDKRGGGRQGQ